MPSNSTWPRGFNRGTDVKERLKVRPLYCVLQGFSKSQGFFENDAGKDETNISHRGWRCSSVGEHVLMSRQTPLYGLEVQHV